VAGPASRPLRDGLDPSGCAGAATVPSFAAVSAAGWEQGDPIAVELRQGEQTVPLRYFRIEADQGEIAAGAPTVAPAEDQDTGGDDRALTMGRGDSVSLGRVDLTQVDVLSLRLCVTGTEGATSYVPQLAPFGAAGAHERQEPPVIASVRQGSPTGPALLGPVDVASNIPTGTRLATEGFGGCYRLLNLPVTGRMTAPAPELFVTVEAAVPGTFRLNSVDIGGTAAKLAAPREVDPPGMKTIFDGSTWAGWTQTNCDLHADGSVSNLRTGAATEVAGCSMTYDRALGDAVLRFEVRRRNFFDNGGMFFGGSEVQLRSVGEYGPGGYFGEYAARAFKLNSWPDWSQVQIARLGARYVVTVNGRTVTDHVASSGDPGPVPFRLATQPEWSYRAGAATGFGQEAAPDIERPSEWGDFWFRDVRALECKGATDPRCLALADANLGQAPQR